jgi:hypothetical protein
MKAILISGLTLVLLTGGALAQASAQPPAPPPPPDGQEAGPDDVGGPPPPPPSRAAHFRLALGDAIVDVKCADDEQMKVCDDITLQFVDRLQTMLKP